MNYYISVLVPMASGRWHAFFPDFPTCEAEASGLDLTRMHAARALAHLAEGSPGEIWVAPPPQDLRDIRGDETWSAAHAIDWARSVVTMIPLCISTDYNEGKSAIIGQTKIDEKVQKPTMHLDEPHDVVVDSSLSKLQKVKALHMLEQDARQLSEATTEGMAGGERTKAA